MARGRVRLAFIMEAAKRKATFRKRRKGLLAKVCELKTLCGTDACAIIFSLDEPVEPMVWPSSLGVQRVIMQFQNKSRQEQTARMFNQETFLRERITKVQKKWDRQATENHEKEMTELLFHVMSQGKSELENLSLEHLVEVERKAEQHLKDINRRMEALGIMDNRQQL